MMADSGHRVRRIGDFQRVLVAAPSYLATRAPIRAIEDLATCDFVAFTMVSDTMTLHSKGKSVSFQPENVQLEVDTIGSTKSAVMAGLGIQHLRLDEIEEELASGKLVQVLPEWVLPNLGIYAVWPDSGPQKALTRRLIDFFVGLSPG